MAFSTASGEREIGIASGNEELPIVITIAITITSIILSSKGITIITIVIIIILIVIIGIASGDEEPPAPLAAPTYYHSLPICLMS